MFKKCNVKLVLFFTIVCSVIGCSSAMAKTNKDVAVEKVNVIGVMTGTDNGFEGDATLTRAQAATIIYKAASR